MSKRTNGPDAIDQAEACAEAIVDEIREVQRDPIVEQMHRTNAKHAREGLMSEIPVKDIVVTIESRPVNHDRVKELAASIEQDGLLQPIIVYQDGGSYVLGPGRHRYEAHKLLGRGIIKANVRQFVDNHQVRLAQAIENVQRHQMTPLEEGEACQVIIDAEIGNGHPGADEFETQKAAEVKVAAMLGVTVKWLQGRLALNRLSPRVQQMLRDGLIHTAHAQVLARLASHKLQEEIAGRAAARKVGFGEHKGEMGYIEPVHRVKDWVDRELRTLQDVPWRLDVEFAGKVACDVCPNNSAKAQGLFEGGDDAAVEKGGAPKKSQCLNAACYSEKNRVAGLAVRKAANTIIKLEISASPKSVERAIEVRGQEVCGMVRPAAVVAAAKKAANPKKKTRSEQTGQQRSSDDWERDNKIREQFLKAYDAWSDPIIEKLEGWVEASPYRMLAIFAMQQMQLLDDLNASKPYKAKAWAIVEPVIRELAVSDDVEAQQNALCSLAAKLEGNKDLQNNLDWAYATHGLIAGPTLALMADLLGLQIDIEPKLEDFQKPKAEEAKPARSVKKKSKKKAGKQAVASVGDEGGDDE